LPILHIGNPENRRVTLFAAALQESGLPAATVFSWEELARAPERLLELDERPRLVRLDAAGENFEVERLFLQLGIENAREEGCWYLPPEQVAALEFDMGRILAPRQVHLGFLKTLERLKEVFKKRPHWVVLPDPDTVKTLFDKRITSRLYHQHAILAPPFLDFQPQCWSSLVEAAATARWPQLFVKLASGSSASCLGLLNFPGPRFFTSMEQTPSKTLYNNLKPRTYTGASAIHLVELLLKEGAQVEKALPKATLPGIAGNSFFDLRVLVIGGEPAFTVVRQSNIPITNLHLGGQRGSLKALEEHYPGALVKAHMVAKAVYNLHPKILHLGVDVMIEAQSQQAYVLEANAFGDLLPGLSRDGKSVYQWEIEVLKEKYHASF
jgi:hypothetical protein